MGEDIFSLLGSLSQCPLRNLVVPSRGQLHTMRDQAESFGTQNILGWPKPTPFHPSEGRGIRAARGVPRVRPFCPAPKYQAGILPLYPFPPHVFK